MLCDAVRSKQQSYLVSWLEHVICVQDKTCKFFLPLSVITQVINLLNGIWRRHLLSNKVNQNSCSLIIENNHCKFSVICVRFIYKYLAFCYFPPFFNPTPFVFFKNISCFHYNWLQEKRFSLCIFLFNNTIPHYMSELRFHGVTHIYVIELIHHYFVLYVVVCLLAEFINS